MGKDLFKVGETLVTFPIDAEDVLWFDKALGERGVDLRAGLTPTLAAARDLGLIVSITKSMAKMAPAGVVFQMQVLPDFDLRLAAAAVSLIRAFRLAHQ